MRKEKYIFRLKGVKSPYDKQFYIGFALDVVREYIGWNSDTYYMKQGGLLSEVREASMFERAGDKGRSLDIKYLGSNKFEICGFPEEERSFEDFKTQAPLIWERMFKDMKPEIEGRKRR